MKCKPILTEYYWIRGFFLLQEGRSEAQSTFLPFLSWGKMLKGTPLWSLNFARGGWEGHLFFGYPWPPRRLQFLLLSQFAEAFAFLLLCKNRREGLWPGSYSFVLRYRSVQKCHRCPLVFSLKATRWGLSDCVSWSPVCHGDTDWQSLQWSLPWGKSTGDLCPQGRLNFTQAYSLFLSK